MGRGVVLYTYIAASPGMASLANSRPLPDVQTPVWTPGNRPERAKIDENGEFHEKCHFSSKSAKTAQTGQFGRPKRPENGRFGGVQTPVSSGNWPKLAKTASLASLGPLRVTLGYPRNPKVTLKGSYQESHFSGSG